MFTSVATAKLFSGKFQSYSCFSDRCCVSDKHLQKEKGGFNPFRHLKSTCKCMQLNLECQSSIVSFKYTFTTCLHFWNTFVQLPKPRLRSCWDNTELTSCVGSKGMIHVKCIIEIWANLQKKISLWTLNVIKIKMYVLLERGHLDLDFCLLYMKE